MVNRTELSEDSQSEPEKGSTIMNSPGENESLPKPGVQGNETYDVQVSSEEVHENKTYDIPRSEESDGDCSPRSDRAVLKAEIVLQPRSKRLPRAKKTESKAQAYNPLRDSSVDSSKLDYFSDPVSSDEDLNRSKTHKKFTNKSNRKGCQIY